MTAKTLNAETRRNPFFSLNANAQRSMSHCMVRAEHRVVRGQCHVLCEVLSAQSLSLSVR
jgi:hypothetical protein